MCMSPEPSPKKPASPAAGSGISAVRQMRADAVGNSTLAPESPRHLKQQAIALETQLHLKLKAQQALEAAFLAEAVEDEKSAPEDEMNQTKLRAQQALEAALSADNDEDDKSDPENEMNQIKFRAQQALEAALSADDNEDDKSAPENEMNQIKLRAMQALEAAFSADDDEDDQRAQVSQLRLRAQCALESVLLPEEEEARCTRVSQSFSMTGQKSALATGQEERARVECKACGYKCVPQWLNDEAHCLKCQAVLKRRPNIHQKHDAAALPARSNSRPATSPAVHRSSSPSPSGVTGPERFYHDTCTFTGTHAHHHGAKRNATCNPTLLSTLSSSQTMSKGKAATSNSTRIECHVCGYKCVPQWLNDQAHCLKCQAVLKTRPSVHQKSSGSAGSHTRSGQRRVTTPASLSDKGSTRQMVGPERFFYDKSTYTGAHAVGGPR